MIKQQYKELYFLFNRWLTLPNHYLATSRYQKPANDEGHYLHLGSGDKYIPGLLNVDGNINIKKDLWLDLRNGLPFKNSSTYFIYCCHTLEHLYPDEAIKLLGEMYRVLKSDGVVRLAVPSFEYALKIVQRETKSEWPRKFSPGSSQAINYLFCEGQHKYAYAYDTLKQFSKKAGFSKVCNYSATSGVSPKKYGTVCVGDEPEGSLIVELSR